MRLGFWLALSCLLPLANANAEDRLVTEGRELFHRYCGSCHGVLGVGNGPAAEVLRVPPPDLTQIRTRNGGMFPYNRLREIIDGRQELLPHGTREMPVWGERFKEEAGGGTGSERKVAARITALLAFIKSIQRDAIAK